MCLRRIQSFRSRYKKRIRAFYSSSIAGSFTGVLIGVLFSLITDTTFNRWIDVFSYELFAAIIYVLFILLGSWFFYHIGNFFIRTFISNKKEDLIGFKINYFAGIYSALFSATLVVLSHNNASLSIKVLVVFVIVYFPLEFFVVRTRE